MGSLAWRAGLRYAGTTPVAGVLAWLDANEPRVGWNDGLRATRARALAMLGRFDEARAILAETRAVLAERGGGIKLGPTLGSRIPSTSSCWPTIRPPPSSSGQRDAGCSRTLGEHSVLSTAAGWLAQALYALDRLEEADAWAGRAAELGSSDDAITQMLWRQVRSKVLARGGEIDEADRLAREAVAVSEKTDFLNCAGRCLR